MNPASDDEEEADRVMAAGGGDVTYPEGMDTTDGPPGQPGPRATRCIWRSTASRTVNTDYFVRRAATASTITGFATTESPSENYQVFKVALWELNDDQIKTSYVPRLHHLLHHRRHLLHPDHHRPDAGQRYKATISYDSVVYYVTGGIKVVGLGSEELTAVETEETA